MIKLDTTQVLYLHNLMCQATGGSPKLRDIGALESALYHAYASFEGKDLYPTIEEKASRQAYGIIRNHPFIDGNKRTGLFVMLVFLELNSIKLYFSQSELVELGMGIAEGKTDSKQITKWIIEYKRNI
jgi:death-on-curing protein